MAIENQRLFQLCQHHDATNRRLRGRSQQTVIATSVQTDDRRRTEAPETVRLEPLARRGRREIIKRVVCKLNSHITHQVSRPKESAYRRLSSLRSTFGIGHRPWASVSAD